MGEQRTKVCGLYEGARTDFDLGDYVTYQLKQACDRGWVTGVFIDFEETLEETIEPSVEDTPGTNQSRYIRPAPGSGFNYEYSILDRCPLKFGPNGQMDLGSLRLNEELGVQRDKIIDNVRRPLLFEGVPKFAIGQYAKLKEPASGLPKGERVLITGCFFTPSNIVRLLDMIPVLDNALEGFGYFFFPAHKDGFLDAGGCAHGTVLMEVDNE